MVSMKRIRPGQTPMRPDGQPMTQNDFRDLRNQLVEFEKVEWIDAGTREIVEQFMPDLADKLPERTTETFDQAFGRMRGAAMRRAAKRRKQHKSRR
jgi:hypothetical protein